MDFLIPFLVSAVLFVVQTPVRNCAERCVRGPSSGLRSRRGFGWFQGRGRASPGFLDKLHQANVDVLTPSCLVAVDREHIAARLEGADGIPPEGNSAIRSHSSISSSTALETTTIPLPRLARSWIR